MPKRAQLDKQPTDVTDMFDGVASRYDLMNDLMTGGQVRLWRLATTKAIDPQPGQLILDLAAGTGTSSQPLLNAGASAVAVDRSIGMLAHGRRRYQQVDFVAGDALALPFADDTFDATTISYGLRNVVDTAAALVEMRRVTKPGGRLVIAEFSTPTWRPFKQVYRWYLGQVMPQLQRFSSNDAAYDYLVESILAWPDQPSLGKTIAGAGWRKVEWKNLTGGIVALHRAWK